jgi:hypothetical protein
MSTTFAGFWPNPNATNYAMIANAAGKLIKAKYPDQVYIGKFGSIICFHDFPLHGARMQARQHPLLTGHT